MAPRSDRNAPVTEVEQTGTKFGFTWTKVEGQYRLRSPENDFTDVPETVVETLRAHAEETPIEDLIAEISAQRSSAGRQLREMYEDGFIRDAAPIERIDPPADVPLWPQFLVTGFLALLVGVAWVRTYRGLDQDLLTGALPPLDVLVVALPIVATSLAVHEYGHYWVAKRQGLDPSFGLSVINLVFPVLVTRTDGGWMLPRNRRIMITLAGPAVGLVFTGLVFGTHYAIVAHVGVAYGALTSYTLQLAALFPLFHGDGYLLLTDLLGRDNLRSHGITDLKARELTAASAYVVVSYGFVIVMLPVNVLIAFVVGDFQGAAFATGLLILAGLIRLRGD